MLLPRAEQAIVPENKVRDYLLSVSHLEGRYKAQFFASFGFHAEDGAAFTNALRNHAISNEAFLSKENEYGRFYNVDGPLQSPDGRNPVIRTVWILEEGHLEPRLITAHPL